jgi:transcriptional regulator
MYIPKHFQETRLDVMHALIRAHPLATLVTLTPDGLVANHIPLHLAESPSPFGVLEGHVARSNPLWKDYSKDVAALAVFQGPESYISPSWYVTKKETGKVVPTWNYAVVHAYGSLRVIEEASWLRWQLEKLTHDNESKRPEPWHISDAPHEFTERLISEVVGLQFVITKLSGKWKVSQNQPAANREGVIQGLQELGTADALRMAAIVRKDGEEKPQ